MKTIKITVTGKVQGVFFRQSCVTKAKELFITGYVRNLSDGNVNIVAQGDEQALHSLLSWCHKGPKKAKVERVLSEKDEAEDIYLDFSIIG